MEHLTRAADSVAVDPELLLTIEHRLTGPEPAAWHFTIADGRIGVGTGPTSAPAITVATSRETAAAIHAGEKSAQRAFLDGDLRIGGDLNLLIQHRRVLDDVAEQLRAAI